MSAEDYAADQLITSRGIQSSAVTDATAARARIARLQHLHPRGSSTACTGAAA